jgi:hypothetical protein
MVYVKTCVVEIKLVVWQLAYVQNDPGLIPTIATNPRIKKKTVSIMARNHLKAGVEPNPEML